MSQSTSTPQASPSEYNKFKDFARRIVAVPKAEVDEITQKEPAKRAKKQDKKSTNRND